MSEEKRLLGQFYTITNPFRNDAFISWLEGIPNIENETIIEPFAGANNIVSLVQDMNPRGTEIYNNWACFDISPSDANSVPEYEVQKQDTIKNFPTGYKVAITNPPYLAKNSATRRGLEYVGDPYDDTYKKALEVMLDNCDYVGAIIPESFITADLFHNRLDTVISLACKMFDDTDCPVCLALFVPEKETNDFTIYRNETRLGTYSELKDLLFTSRYKIGNWKVNDPKGSIGVCCVDSQKGQSTKFMNGEEIPEEDIKGSSRAFTRISGLPDNIDRIEFIRRCNTKLNEYRKKTKDVFLTSFKGLRQDGKYRRRLDFKTVKAIMCTVLEEMEKEV